MSLDLATRLAGFGVLPVVTVATPDRAMPLVEALAAGGLACVEITFRSEAAAAAIAAIRAGAPDVLVGAGTILTRDQAAAALDAGAAFLVSPGLAPDVVDWALARDVPMLPGIATASELMAALSRGLRVVKVFPAGPLGGPAYLRALEGPFPMMRFVPTGGVTAANLPDYLALESVVAVGGTWLARPDVVAGGRWTEVELLAREAVAMVREVRP